MKSLLKLDHLMFVTLCGQLNCAQSTGGARRV